MKKRDPHLKKRVPVFAEPKTGAEAPPLNAVLCGDSLDVLRQYPDNFFDSIVTDPPYGLSKEPNITEVLTKWLAGDDYTHRGGGFMGKTWDSFVPGPTLWREVFRVLKPGGHVLCFAGTRTQDLMTIALRLGGFEVRDVIEWLYLSGFPKSMDVGKAFDKAAGVKGERVASSGVGFMNAEGKGGYNVTTHRILMPERQTDLAQEWDGWGTALKPAHEPIIVARKPLERTVAYNVEKHGTGALNIDGCRVQRSENDRIEYGRDRALPHENTTNSMGKFAEVTPYTPHDAGRFPANCVTLDSDEWYSPYFNVTPREISKKASKRDRGEGNTHPTVKSVDLMAWLVRLVTPPGGIVLDPFCGSGSTLVAAKREGFSFVGVDLTPEYGEIAVRRVHSAGESHDA